MRHGKIRLLAIIFTACLFSTTAASATTEKLVIISPHWEGIRKEFDRGFADWCKANKIPKIEITWIDQGGTSDDLLLIKSGFSKNPKTIDIDLFYGGGIDPYVELAGEGLLVPYKLPQKTLDSIPKELNGIPLYDPQYRWYGSSLAGFGIVYNKRLIKMYSLPTPRTWRDLAVPSLFQLVGSSDPRHSGSTHMMYELILQSSGWAKGWKTILGMGANARSFPKSASQVTKDLAVGDIAAGLAIDTYAYTAIEESGATRLGFSMPANASVINPDPIAILKGAPHIDNAKTFIRFTLSPAGQKIWMLKKGAKGGPKDFSLNKMAIVPSVYKGFEKNSNVQINPFKSKQKFTYDFKTGSARWNFLNDLIGAFVIDTHDDLAAAWKAAGKNKKKQAALLAPPISESAANALIAKWDDPVIRNKTINEWLGIAKKRYSKK